MTTIKCECCWIAPVELSLTNDVRYCQPCRGHQYSIENLRTDHGRFNEALIANHATEIANLTSEIEQSDARITALCTERDTLVETIAGNLSEAPEGALLERISDATVNDLQDRLRAAYSGCDHAMAAVWCIDELHPKIAMGGRCACGKALRACREYKAFEFFHNEDERWERKQTDLMKAGKDHSLPTMPKAARCSRSVEVEGISEHRA